MERSVRSPDASIGSLRRFIPAGIGLSPDVWRSRHRFIVTIAWLHVLGVPIYGMAVGQQIWHAVLEGVPIAIFAGLATTTRFSQRARAAAASAALLTSSAILVHFSGGLIEMHFHFFVMVPLVALYQDWIPFLLAIGYVLIHHGLMGQIAPETVYNHPWGQANPWAWAAVHAGFIAAASAVCIVAWRVNEMMLDRQARTEADLREEKRVAETLHSVGTGIASELDVARVAQLVTDEATKATGAAFGAFFYNVRDSNGESFMLYTISGVPRSAFESFPMPRNTAIFEPTFSGKSAVRIDDVTSDPRYGHSPPYHGMPQGHLPVKSYLAVPVRSRGSADVLGGLFFGHPDAGVFTEHHERVAEGIAVQAAVAFDNARLYEAEREAREAAEQARARLAMLADVGRALVSSLDPEHTLQNLLEITVPALADLCVVDLVSEDGEILRVAAAGAAGFEGFAQDLKRFPPDPSNPEHPAVRVVGGAEPILVEDVPRGVVERNTRSEEHAELARRMDGTSHLVVPLVGRDRVLGAVSFMTLAASGRRFGPDDVPLAAVLGRRAGMAVENARLYQAEREARSAADMAGRRLALLAESGRLVASVLDLDDALGHLAHVTVPTMADACLIDVLEDDGTIRRVAAGAPGLEGLAQRLSAFAPRSDDADHPVVRVMNGAEPVVVERIDDAFRERVSSGPEHRAVVEEMDVRSAIIVPLTARGTTYGALSLIDVASSGRSITKDDLPLVEELGRRAGMAVENARMYGEQRSVAESLQHALLPEQLPEIPGFDVSARYLPGSPGERVGGDWYDLFEIPSGEIVVAIGDVVGHGIPAASKMAQLRNALRAYAWSGMAPAEILTRLNQLLCGLEREGMATISIGVLDPVSGSLRLGNAGHPPLLHVSQGGHTSFLGEGLGPPIGVVPHARYLEDRIEIATEDLLVFYTDGLVEDRAAPLDTGLERMRSAVTADTEDLAALTDRVLAVSLQDRVVEDDIALLVLKSLAMGKKLEMRFKSEPRSLASFRQTLRRWLRENDVDETELQDILLACGEACNNAVEHGSAKPDGFVEVLGEIDDNVTIVIRSPGPWRTKRQHEGGRGIPVMRAVMDEVEISSRDGGTEVKMRRRLHGAAVAG